ncbi:phospholipase D-like domain-containing protein [Bordetella petrii]|uniref:Phospholipase D-like domain-containing protein n=1 Tax=Bordetella petrii TaxID=94624 RepID=A0ABT7W9C2_9BORD|nr:phospholipase D-like domain-containing protein [Bordetella petrii]
MSYSVLHAFDVLAPHAEVSAPLCVAAAQGRLDLPSDVHTICTRAGLPRARAGDIERALSVGRQLGLFGQIGPLSWHSCDNTLASQLAPLLEGARLYRTRVHQDTDLVDVVLTKPPAPSQVSRKLESMLSGGWGFRDTKQLLPAIAGGAHRSLIVMTPFFDGVGAEVVLNLFENTVAPDRCLILRATKEGLPPEGLVKVGAQLIALGVDVVNFRLDRPGSSENETFHAKTVLGDDDAAYVGSSNMNQWSFEHSLELGLYVRGRAAFRIAELLRAIRAVSGSMT